MPLPTRRKGESREDFISRFMSDEKVKSEYPDQKQRVAIAMSQANKFAKNCEIIKADESLGIVFGMAVVTKVGDKDYTDLQGDQVTEKALVESAAEFMQNSRIAGDMHKKGGDKKIQKAGSVVFAFPLTSDIAKSMGITSEKYGLLVGLKPDDPEILQKVKRGEITGFSIGGSVMEAEEYDSEE